MVQYHFKTKEGSSVGPINADEFRQHLETGAITDATMVWRSGLIDWTTYGALRAFDEEMARQRATPPPLPVRQTSQEPAPLADARQGKASPKVTSAPVCASPASGTAGGTSGINQSPNGEPKKGGGWVVQALGMVAVVVVCCGMLLGALWLRYYMSKSSRVVQQEARLTASPAR